MQTPSSLLTIVQSLDVISMSIVYARSGLTLLQALTYIVYTNVRLQIETSDILSIELESSTVGISSRMVKSSATR